MNNGNTAASTSHEVIELSDIDQHNMRRSAQILWLRPAWFVTATFILLLVMAAVAAASNIDDTVRMFDVLFGLSAGAFVFALVIQGMERLSARGEEMQTHRRAVVLAKRIRHYNTTTGKRDDMGVGLVEELQAVRRGYISINSYTRMCF